MYVALQARLLRVLEDSQVWRVGARTGRTVDVRVVAATNADLRQRINGGPFRQELYYRLAHFTVEVPPLRERLEDIPLLARHFPKLFAAEMGREPSPLSEEVLARLRSHDYPGNARELKNLIERALIESGGGEVRPVHLHFLSTGRQPDPPAQTPAPAPELPLDIDQAIAQTERWVVRRALELSDGNVSAATRLLGTNRNRIYRILGLEQPRAAEPAAAPNGGRP
jgi:DNA-binding NtrC family response regulator